MQIFLTSGTGTDILMKVFEDYLTLHIFSKNKGFQSGALLKTPSLSLSMKEFDQQQKRTKKLQF